MIRELLEPLLAGEDLGADHRGVSSLMAGEWSEPEQAAFLIALRAKGETPGEVAAAARVLRSFAVLFPVAARRSSTPAARVATAPTPSTSRPARRWWPPPAASRWPSTGTARCRRGAGSVDVIEALGVPLELEPEQLGALLDEVGFTFLFAPRLHPAMRAVMPVRRAAHGVQPPGAAREPRRGAAPGGASTAAE